LADKRDDAKAKLDALEAAEPAPQPPPEDEVVEAEATPEQDPVAPKNPPVVEDRAERSAEPSRNWLGLGLTVGGGVTTVIGAGLTVGWWTVNSQAESFADTTEGYELGGDLREPYLQEERNRARKWLIAGAVVGSVGIAVAAGGVTHILLRRRARSEPEALTFVPYGGPEGFGLRLGRRF
jgi:hypothetical protein